MKPFKTIFNAQLSPMAKSTRLIILHQQPRSRPHLSTLSNLAAQPLVHMSNARSLINSSISMVLELPVAGMFQLLRSNLLLPRPVAIGDNQQLRLRKVRKQLKHLHGVQPPSQMHNFLKPNLLVGVQFQLLSLPRFNIRVLGPPPLNSSSNALLNPEATSSNWVTTILRIDSRPPSRIPI